RHRAGLRHLLDRQHGIEERTSLAAVLRRNGHAEELGLGKRAHDVPRILLVAVDRRGAWPHNVRCEVAGARLKRKLVAIKTKGHLSPPSLPYAAHLLRRRRHGGADATAKRAGELRLVGDDAVDAELARRMRIGQRAPALVLIGGVDAPSLRIGNEKAL